MAATVVTPEQFGPWLQREQERMEREAVPLLAKAMTVKVRSAVQRNFDDGTGPNGAAWPPLAFARPRGGNKPLLDTGRLRASIQAQAEADGVRAGTVAPQAALLNDGGTVTPKQGKYLAIPLSRKAQLAGSPRRFSGELGVKFGPRGGLMFERGGKGKKAREVPHFALARKVVVPARPFLYLDDEAMESLGTFALDFLARRWGR